MRKCAVPVVRRGPPVPDRVLTSRFTGLPLVEPLFVPTSEPLVVEINRIAAAKVVVRRRNIDRPDQREGRCMRVFGEAYPVSCPRYRCPVYRAGTAAGGRDAGEGVDRRPGVDVYRVRVHADAEVRLPVVRRGPPVPDRVLTSRFTDFRGRTLVRPDERTACGGDHDCVSEVVVRWRQRWRRCRCWCGRGCWILPTIPPAGVQTVAIIILSAPTIISVPVHTAL